MYWNSTSLLVRNFLQNSSNDTVSKYYTTVRPHMPEKLRDNATSPVTMFGQPYRIISRCIACLYCAVQYMDLRRHVVSYIHWLVLLIIYNSFLRHYTIMPVCAANCSSFHMASF